MKKALKTLAAAIAAVSLISCAQVSSFADKLRTIDGLRYRCTDSGEIIGLYTGWAVKDNKLPDPYVRYYYKNGRRIKNKWLRIRGKYTYWFNNEGRMVRGINIIGSKTCVFSVFDGKLITADPEKTGVSMEAKDVTALGMTFVIRQSGGEITGELMTGEEYFIERKNGEEWESIEYIHDEVNWNDIAWIIPENESTEHEVKFSNLYGELPAGEYRMGKEIWDFRGTRDLDEYIGYCYFTV